MSRLRTLRPALVVAVWTAVACGESSDPTRRDAPDAAEAPDAADAPDARDRVVRTIQAELRKATFEPCDEPSQITIPFSFD